MRNLIEAQRAMRTRMALREPARVVIAAPAPIADGPLGVSQAVALAWRYRQCFICGEYGRCAHREPEVEVALIEATTRGEERQWKQSVA